MGSCVSAAAERKRLRRIDEFVQQAPWNHSGDLAQLDNAVQELVSLHKFFAVEREGRDFAEVAQVQRLGDTLVHELASQVSKEQLRAYPAEDVRCSAVLGIARDLDSVRDTKASALIADTLHRSQLALVSEHVQEAERRSKALPALERTGEVAASSKQVLLLLQQAQAFGMNNKEANALILKSSTLFANTAIAVLQGTAGLEPKACAVVVQVCEELDTMCQALATAIAAPWEPVAPKLRALNAERVAESITVLLDAAQTELAKTSGVNHMKLLEDIAKVVQWSAVISPEAEVRLHGVVTKIVDRVQAAFDKALESAEMGTIDALLLFGTQLAATFSNAHCAGKEEAKGLKAHMDSKKAHLNVASMLKRARSTVSTQCETLSSSYAEVHQRVTKVPRERLEETEPPAWKFKARNGFKNFSPEKSTQVEALYQDWLNKGRPNDIAARRYEIAIQVEASRASRRPTVKSRGPGRTLCKWGAECYQKNPDHKRRFAHPGDEDWPAEEDETVDDQPELSTVMEAFSLDFLLMTQVNIAKAGMRNLNRVEGQTLAQSLTHAYFSEVIDFVKSFESTFSKAEVEMRMLGADDRAIMEEQIGNLLQEIRRVVVEFLSLAVTVCDMKAIEELLALLGSHADEMGVHDSLKGLRLGDVLDELRQGYAEGPRRHSPGRWALLRLLVRQRLFKVRLSLRSTKAELRKLTRRRCQMRCQAFLTEYAEDEAVCAKFREDAAEILGRSLDRAAEQLQTEAVMDILKAATALQCDLSKLRSSVGRLVQVNLRSSCRSRRLPLARVCDELDTASNFAKLLQVAFDELFDVDASLPDIAQRALQEAQRGDRGSVSQVKVLRDKLFAAASTFDEELWAQYKVWYTSALESGSTDKQAAAVEWAIAYAEQIGRSLPEWMMNKDQVEALKMLQSAIENGQEQELQKAVIFAKQTDYKSDPQLSQLYDNSLRKLRDLKRLPDGWIFDPEKDTTGKVVMYKKVDEADLWVKELFQKLFDSTKKSIVTRDRDGAMPRGYRVERIQSVMNAESWGSYMKRRDDIGESCKRFAGAAPCPDMVWASWNGTIATKDVGHEILGYCKVPDLANHTNESFMFHGTKPDAADAIAQNHFDMAFACKTGLFGAGLYFAESISKADEYVKPDGNNHYPIIMCRVTLGRINYCSAADPTREPGRDKLESSCLGGEYHSVLGDRIAVRGTYREFIVYDHFQVYPHFIVWYSRL